MNSNKPKYQSWKNEKSSGFTECRESPMDFSALLFLFGGYRVLSEKSI